MYTLKNVQHMHVDVKGYICTREFVSVYVCVVLQWAACGGTEGLCMMGSVGGLRDSP